MRVIGTAGHVDHGKSTLVHRLTQIDPDRLAEEKQRQMTIDLGFAWLQLPGGEMVGIIDVPGHRDFIENMLAGVGGIDAVLLVIAADEGVMPQTREHLAILDLLGITHGLIVLSKTDLVDDPEWLALVEQDIREVTRPTGLANAAIVPVSARTGAGLLDLTDRLTLLLADLPQQIDRSSPRLAVDRVFTISGFGTVVTGTLLGGTLQVGSEIEIQPSALRGRIRGLQSYKQPVEVAQPGSRVAVNISGIERTTIQRGDVLTYPRQFPATLLADVHFRHLPDASRPLKHNAEVKLFVGAAETTGRVRLLDADILPPGDTGWLQIRLEKPLSLAQGDRFILRYPSPGETIGGGVVINPQPGRRWKRLQPDVIERLELQMRGSPIDRVLQAASQPEPMSAAALQKQLGYTEVELQSLIAEALDDNRLVELWPGVYMAAEFRASLAQQILAALTAFHHREPLRAGMQREHLRSQLHLKQAVFNALAASLDQVEINGGSIRLREHQVRFTPAQEAQIRQLRQMMLAAPYTPPSPAEATAIVGEPVLTALIEMGEIIRVQADVIFARATYEEMVAAILGLIDQNGQITASELRDQFNTTRKYAIGLLEHLDNLKVTRRQGDARIRGPNA
ncbi:MAG: selenocysteine-specific translation elongation factor [Anaerolineae bacterium]|nr:selenocysteine-specific translation elongation factor [Anaerolineae bacterium]